MLQMLLAAALAAALIAVSTLAARWRGPHTGGIVSAFPAIAGPVLVLVFIEHGPVAAARNAEGTLLGLVSLAAFTAAYGRTATQRGWMPSLLSGWSAAALAGLAAAFLGTPATAPFGLLVASASLLLAHHVVATSRPTAKRVFARAPRGPRIPVRMAMTGGAVLALSAAVDVLGPLAGGVLAALPVLASLLTVLEHRDAGAGAAVAVLSGTLAGMAGFVAFCATVALLITRAAAPPVFAAATLAAVVAQAPVLRGHHSR